MTVHVFSAAKRVGSQSGWSVTNLVMQKLIYLAHMVWLGTHHEPLVNGNFEAWDLGPVHPTLYHHVKFFGSSPVQNIFSNCSDMPDRMARVSGLDHFTEKWADNAPKLIAITHSETGAWASFYSSGKRQVIIPDDAIRQEYERRARQPTN